MDENLSNRVWILKNIWVDVQVFKTSMNGGTPSRNSREIKASKSLQSITTENINAWHQKLSITKDIASLNVHWNPPEKTTALSKIFSPNLLHQTLGRPQN